MAVEPLVIVIVTCFMVHWYMFCLSIQHKPWIAFNQCHRAIGIDIGTLLLQVMAFNMGSLGFLTNHSFPEFMSDLQSLIYGCQKLDACTFSNDISVDESELQSSLGKQGLTGHCPVCWFLHNLVHSAGMRNVQLWLGSSKE